MWPSSRILDLFKIEVPILQAPMAGSSGVDLALAVSKGGGLGALPCAMMTEDDIRAAVGVFRQRVKAPLNLNFFCHKPAVLDNDKEAGWRRRLAEYYEKMGISLDAISPGPSRAPFSDATCAMVEEIRPEVVSFHFGLPERSLVERVKATGAIIISSATTVDEARHLASAGCDAIIAQGSEAGGHRGMFLSDDITGQVGTFALVPQVVDAVDVPVIAAGGIGDGRGIAAAMVLGASAVQIGTAYLRCPEALTGTLHRQALADDPQGERTALTNVFTGRPARSLANRLVREVGPMSSEAPSFPTAAAAVLPLRAKAEAEGIADFTPLWAGQAAALSLDMPATELTKKLALDAQSAMKHLFAPAKKSN